MSQRIESVTNETNRNQQLSFAERKARRREEAALVAKGWKTQWVVSAGHFALPKEYELGDFPEKSGAEEFAFAQIGPYAGHTAAQVAFARVFETALGHKVHVPQAQIRIVKYLCRPQETPDE
ncbi:hypothetical protein [Marinimicrobium sp. ABcell2]|uniref:hypothetical protein n=1 Tax=Marinimicrobium sp. ABcell2 TaxID=3069751 RepID=UPI0027B3A6C9|nr:hypothetical protein [Marinimicrobium sp. ABcell2]MDQ2077428.1 hypothetical protein [Marinimicrobium sp. ABcell2]